MNFLYGIDEDNNEAYDIFIELPNVYKLTDEDSTDEDLSEGENMGIEKLSGNQLRAPDEVHL